MPTGKAARDRAPSDRDFGDALAAAKVGKAECCRQGMPLDAAAALAAVRNEARRRNRQDGRPRPEDCRRESRRAGAGRVGGFKSNEDFVNAGAGNPSEAEDADAGSRSALPGGRPPVQARRIAATEKTNAAEPATRRGRPRATVAIPRRRQHATSAATTASRRRRQVQGSSWQQREFVRPSWPSHAACQAGFRAPMQTPKPQLAWPPVREPAVGRRSGQCRGHSGPQPRRSGKGRAARDRHRRAEHSRRRCLHRRSFWSNPSPPARPPVAGRRQAGDRTRFMLRRHLRSAQSLKIQLHPAELGMVTATLRFAGEQLSIELQVENHEAYQRLQRRQRDDREVAARSRLRHRPRHSSATFGCIGTPARAPTPAQPMPVSTGRGGEQFGPARPAAATPERAAGNREETAPMRARAARKTLRQNGSRWRRHLYLGIATIGLAAHCLQRLANRLERCSERTCKPHHACRPVRVRSFADRGWTESAISPPSTILPPAVHDTTQAISETPKKLATRNDG